jgi:NAD(P)-dependent dehydrogenase (short-subunit alcohol dehydrogenase family)
MADIDTLFSLEGRTALVTGAVRGIGLAITRMFAGAGARLVLVDHDADGCHALAAELGAFAVVADLADPGAIADLAALPEVTRGIDVLVCNAGIAGAPSPMHEMAEEDRERLFAVNLLHPMRLCNAIAPRMAAAGGGTIILLSSIAGLRGNARLGTYGMTKAAVSQLARNLAVEWGPDGVRANAIAPGLIETDWADAIVGNPEAHGKRMGLTPLRRIGKPQEIAATALYLASDAGAFTTGQTIVVDGGTLISDGN